MLSRYRFIFPVLEETAARAIQGCEAAWAFFGGIFRVVIPDDTKAIVNGADPQEPASAGEAAPSPGGGSCCQSATSRERPEGGESRGMARRTV